MLWVIQCRPLLEEDLEKCMRPINNPNLLLDMILAISDAMLTSVACILYVMMAGRIRPISWFDSCISSTIPRQVLDKELGCYGWCNVKLLLEVSARFFIILHLVNVLIYVYLWSECKQVDCIARKLNVHQLTMHDFRELFPEYVISCAKLLWREHGSNHHIDLH